MASLLGAMFATSNKNHFQNGSWMYQTAVGSTKQYKTLNYRNQWAFGFGPTVPFQQLGRDVTDCLSDHRILAHFNIPLKS